MDTAAQIDDLAQRYFSPSLPRWMSLAESLAEEVRPRYNYAVGGAVTRPVRQWLKGSIEDALKPLLRRHPGTRETPDEFIKSSERYAGNPDIARQVQQMHTAKQVNNWINSNLGNYIRRDMGTDADPLQDLMERGVGHTNQSWPGIAAGFINRRDAGDVLKWAGEEPYWKRVATENEWLNRLDPETKVFYPSDEVGGEFSHLIDELWNATRADTDLPPELRLKPESLRRVSVPQASELVGKINRWRSEQAAKANAELANNAATHLFREYPESGFRWVELKEPESRRSVKGHPLSETAAYAALRDALKYEGDTMGHCVGGYCDDVVSGRSRIFSLRDSTGQPHVTIETSPRVRMGEQGSELDPDLQDIIQIKGKGNKAPVDKYLPMVQDFVRSGTWGEANDLQNAGLIRLLRNIGPIPDPTPNARMRVRNQLTSLNPTLDNELIMNLAEDILTGNNTPVFATEQELIDLVNSWSKP